VYTIKSQMCDIVALEVCQYQIGVQTGYKN